MNIKKDKRFVFFLFVLMFSSLAACTSKENSNEYFLGYFNDQAMQVLVIPQDLLPIELVTNKNIFVSLEKNLNKKQKKKNFFLGGVEEIVHQKIKKTHAIKIYQSNIEKILVQNI